MSYLSEIHKYKNNIALITEKENITYSSIIELSKKFFNKVKERSLVLIKCENSFEIITVWLTFLITQPPNVSLIRL